MRQDPQQFVAFERARSKEPRFVVEIAYPSGSIYLTSHSDISNLPTSPATIIQGVLKDFATQSQRLHLDQGRAEIGSGKFSVVDKSLAVTLNLRSKLNAGAGPRKQTVKYWKGYKPIDAAPDWSKFVLQQTQLLSGDSFDLGTFEFQSEDISREARKDIFDLATTNLTTPVAVGDTTINVSSTAAFELLAHGAYYSDAPSATVGYFKIKNEVVRYTGKTSTTFTGCTRGALGTVAAAYAVDTTLPPERREKVTEHVYLEEPAVKLLYAILTGSLYGTANVLPSRWHLGISSTFVRVADFLAMTDIWNTTVETDSVFMRFEGITKTDGKAFVEKEIAFPLGLFQPIYADGSLGLRRMTRALASSAAVLTFDESNIIEMSGVDRAYSDLLNGVIVSWSYRGSEAQRTTAYIDADSIAVHKSAPPKKLAFKGIHGSRHTDGVLRKLAGRILDAYSAPPVKSRLKALSSLSAIEVGDVVRVKHPGHRDYSAGAGAALDRSFLVTGVSNSQESGEIEIDLFGSTASGKSVASVSGQLLPLAFYTGRGTNLASVLTLTQVGSEWVVQTNATLTGNVDATVAGAEFYFDGNLRIPTGITITIANNVHLKVRGFVQVDGKIDGKGQGKAGAADDGTGYTGSPYWTGTHAAGLPGYVGNTRGYDGLHVFQRGGNPVMQTLAPVLTQGLHATAPELMLAYDVTNNVIKGLPTDLRGTSGGQGGKVLYQGTHVQAGGAGGASGAGLIITCRGLAVGASGEIDLSGNDGVVAGFYPWENKGYYAGGGAGGGPGTLQVLLDGDTVSYPSLTGQFKARVGTVPQPTSPAVKTYLDTTDVVRRSEGDQPYGGYADPRTISNIDLSFACLRVQNAPGVESVVADGQDVPPPPTNLTATGWPLANRIIATLPDPATYDATEYWAASSNDRNLASRVAIGKFSEYLRSLAASTTEYYWARNILDGVPSDWFPASATAGVSATSQAGGSGPPGADGTNTATVYLFQRTASATPPSLPGSDITYTFATGGAAGITNGWAQTMPTSGGAYRWMTTALALGTGPTDTIPAAEWAAASLIAQDGANGTNGTNGLNTALVYIYKRSASAPALPTASATYTFATGAITGLDNGWASSPPAGSDPIYVSVATASSSGSSDSIAPGEWTSPVVLAQNGANGSNGTNGVDGLNAATVYLFQRTASATPPSLPSASVTYTFATGAATGVDNGWTQTLPTTGGAYRWVTTASALSSNSSDTIAPAEWAAASLLAQDGANGTNGTDARILVLDSDGALFKFDAAGAASPAGQVVTLTARRQNLANAVSWSTSPSVTLGGSGDTRTLAIADFGANTSVVVTATITENSITYTSSMTIFRIVEPSTVVTLSARSVKGNDQGFAATGNVSSNEGTGNHDPSPVMSNGASPITHLWEQIQTLSGPTPSCSNTAIASPVWNATDVADGTPSVSIWEVTATDNNSVVRTAQIYVKLIWVDLT